MAARPAFSLPGPIAYPRDRKCPMISCTLVGVAASVNAMPSGCGHLQRLARLPQSAGLPAEADIHGQAVHWTV
ncbi:hypothetical protein MPLB_2010004 [Mesorhizobium sp. ORS 3324]|nr:hypothetical protein MPLB_2010004 [Mesorhizobium sp. ORS 3324]